MRTTLAPAASVLAFLLAGCQSVPTQPVPRTPSLAATVENTALRFQDDAGAPGLVRVAMPASGLRVGTVLSPISSTLARKPIIMSQLPAESTIADIVGMMQTKSVGVPIAFRWKNGDGTDVLKKRAPFTKYEGDVGGLLDTLRRGAGIVSWQEGGTIYISDADRFSITLPQNKDILESTAASLTALGATDVVTSLDAGTLIYSAPPDLQAETVSPFLSKLTNSLATVNMQVAIVSLALNDKFAQGFDWSKLQVALSSPEDRSSTGTVVDSDGVVRRTNSFRNGNDGLYDGNLGNGQDEPLKKAIDNIVSGTGISIGYSKEGTAFGEAVVGSVAGAIDFLSSFGTTNITQHVDLRTVSGKPVKFFSGQEIPYVSDISATSTYGSNNTIGGTETETVEVGLKMEMTPRFDADAELVTVDLDLELSSVLEFIPLSGGNQLGTFYRPRTQNQTLNDIVRLRAGQTVVLGGLQYDQETFAGTEPSFLRDRLVKAGKSLGSRSNDTTRNALFVIMRPVVTVYDMNSASSTNSGGLK